MKLTTLLLLCTALFTPLHAETILFVGNSFTYGAGDQKVLKWGGVPAMVKHIATEKGKTADVTMIAKGGKDWGYHLENSNLDAVLKKEVFDWVVLQDYSTKATHIGNPEVFFEQGKTLFELIQKEDPQAHLLLYSTWAREKTHPLVNGKPESKSFENQAQMLSEVTENYQKLQQNLRALAPEKEVKIAPVGEAFALASKQYPDIPLYSKDRYHASAQGSYLSALVMYASIFHDSPRGAVHTFDSIEIDPQQAEQLQKVAEEIVSARK